MQEDSVADWLRLLSTRLEETNSLLRVLVRMNLESVELQGSDKIAILKKAGLRAREIAFLLSMSTNAVSAALHRQKKGLKRSAKIETKA